MKTVTVIIPTYNHAKFISEAIESVLNQDYPKEKIEIIVIDDGSTDNTKEIVKKYKKVRYYYQKNQGQASALKRGIQKSTGEYIFFLNADDLFLNNKISCFVNIFENDKNIVCIQNPTIILKNKKEIIENIPKEIIGKKHGEKLILLYLKNNQFYGGGSNYAGRSEILKKINLKKEMYMYPDEFIVYSLLNKGNGYFLRKHLTKYRIHNYNYSKINITKKQNNILANITILKELQKNNFSEKIISLYKLKIIISKIRLKEQLGSKTIKDIIELWKKTPFNLKIIWKYGIIKRSFPQFIYTIRLKLLNKL